MASSNIKLFDENKGNMISDSEFSISNQRLNGLQTGVASSQLQNKAMYQASLVAYAIAQVMMQNGLNANDTDAVSTFVANLSNTMLQKVYDVATTAEAQAGVATGKWMSPALVKAAIDTLAAKAQNILSDETKALYSLGSNAVPNDVFVKIAQLLQNNFSTLLGLLTGQTTFVESFQSGETCDTAPMGIRKTMSTTGFPSKFGEWALVMTYYYNAEKSFGWQIAYDMAAYQIAYRYKRNSSWFDWNYIAITNAEGTFTGKVRSNPTARAVLTDYQLRDIAAGSTDMTAGSTALSNGLVYLVYE